MNFKFNITCVDEGETKVNATCEVTEIDASTAFQMMKALRESPEQIRMMVKTAYDCIGAEQKRQFDADLQLRRDELEFRKERAEKEDYWKARAEELEKKNDELRNKLWEAGSNK